MKLPTMTTSKQWLALLAIVIVEAILAFIFFGIVAAYLGLKNT